MRELPVNLHQPFGPYILESQCPQTFLDQINQWCDEKESSEEYSSLTGNTPDLLKRNIENVFFSYEFLYETGFNSFIESVGNYYLDHCSYRTKFPIKETLRMSLLSNHPKFLKSNKIDYADAWVNRYYSGDYTPIHSHAGELSAVILLKVTSNDSEDDKQRGKVIFVNDGDDNKNNLYIPHNQENGILIMFPSWLSHFTYPLRNSCEERRTMSINLVTDTQFLL